MGAVLGLHAGAALESGQVSLTFSISDAAFGQVVGGELNTHLVTGQDANVVLAHFAGDMSDHNMSII